MADDDAAQHQNASTDTCMTNGWSCELARLPECIVVLHRGAQDANSDAHRLENPLVAITLGGNCETFLQHRRYESSVSAGWVEPAFELRRNRAGREGAILLSVVPDVDGPNGMFRLFREALGRPALVRSPVLAVTAHQAALELRHRDSLASVALLGHVLTLLASVARTARTSRLEGREPKWMRIARDHLHEHFREQLDVAALARVAGVSTEHLSRTFSRFTGASIAEYARRLRVAWAAEAILRGERPLAQIAAAAGYFDQSHFTREFRRRMGATPAEYRRLMTQRTSPRT